MKKYWIRGHKTRGNEVIKALEELGGVNPQNGFNGRSESSIYYINENNEIYAVEKRNELAATIMWAGEELKLPEQKPEPKFKIGDKVKLRLHSNEGIYTVKDVHSFSSQITYNIDSMKYGYIYEEDLCHTNNLKKYDPVMVSADGTIWGIRLYCRDNMVYSDGMTYSIEKNETKSWQYIVPLADFDFNDVESNIKRSVV